MPGFCRSRSLLAALAMLGMSSALPAAAQTQYWSHGYGVAPHYVLPAQPPGAGHAGPAPAPAMLPSGQMLVPMVVYVPVQQFAVPRAAAPAAAPPPAVTCLFGARDDRTVLHAATVDSCERAGGEVAAATSGKTAQ
ncbi:MAG: hypothetical protein RLO22_26055 [Sneathiellaceae bacterium]